MTENLQYLKGAIEHYRNVLFHYVDEHGRNVSIRCTWNDDVMMVDDTIVAAFATRMHNEISVRLHTIALSRVLMVVTDYPLFDPDRTERLIWIRTADGRFEPIRTEVWAA